jgi:hypothetical protein
MTGTTRLLLVVLTSLVVLLAACSGPQSAHLDPSGDAAFPAAVSSKISWSPGSAVARGKLTGLAGANVALDGTMEGFYPAVCVNTRSNPTNPQYNEAPGLRGVALSASESDVFRVRRGAITFGDGGETFIIEDPVLGDEFVQLGETQFFLLEDGDLGHDCPNGSNWVAAVDATRFFITDIDLTVSELKGKDDTVSFSWECDPNQVTDDSLGCTQIE